MSSVLAQIALIAGISVTAQSYYANTLTGGIYRIETRLCTPVFLCNSLMFGDIAWYNGGLYGIQGVYVYSIDMTTGASTQIGVMGSGISYPGLVGDGQGRLYSCDIMGGVSRFDIATALSTPVGNAGIGCNGDMTLVDDTLFMIGSGSVLVKMSLNPFSASTVGVMNFGGTAPHPYGLVHGPDPGTLYAAVGYNGVNKLFKVSRADASVTIACDSLGTLNSNVFGLATDAEDVNTSGFPWNAVDSNFKLYPNPATDQITIEGVMLLGVSSLQVYNTQGIMVHSSEEALQGTLTLTLPDIPDGIYVLVIRGDEGSMTKRFVMRQ